MHYIVNVKMKLALFVLAALPLMLVNAIDAPEAYGYTVSNQLAHAANSIARHDGPRLTI